ncbi:hypothetical protein BRC81_11660 [Halobacteriales archaeon QS_1_68_20]|nr:MAG: hypothetical protein BRC81_11660 [Halobacteriales archaeon QS_1_68_20]
MRMAVSSTDRVGRRLREVSPDAVAGGGRGTAGSSPGGVDVVHFDQLDHDQQDAFLRLLQDEPATLSVPAGTVIVQTAYYRIERS